MSSPSIFIQDATTHWSLVQARDKRISELEGALRSEEQARTAAEQEAQAVMQTRDSGAQQSEEALRDLQQQLITREQQLQDAMGEREAAEEQLSGLKGSLRVLAQERDEAVQVRGCVYIGPWMPMSAPVCAGPGAGRSCARGRHMQTLWKPVSGACLRTEGVGLGAG